MEKKVLQTIIQGCIDELVEDFMIFQNPLINKSLPKTSCVFLPSPPLNSLLSIVAL